MVPELLRGCWRRAWIRCADGTVDDTSTVIWLQLESLMADVRVPASHRGLSNRGSLAACTSGDLRRLADSESSASVTRCIPIETGADGVRRATAEWPGSAGDVAFQPVTAYPEPGLLEWNGDGSVMIERAPSGAYVEEWHRIADTDGPLVHQVIDHRSQLFVAGSVAVFVRDRLVPIARAERLEVLVAEAGDDRAALEALVDCEFSVAERDRRGHYAITASTHPWLVGELLDVAV